MAEEWMALVIVPGFDSKEDAEEFTQWVREEWEEEDFSEDDLITLVLKASDLASLIGH